MKNLFPIFIGPPGAIGLLMLRLVVGLALVLHGFPKIQDPFNWMGSDSWAPPILQSLSALAEFGGGLALILGLLTPIACFGIVCNMLTAIVAVHLNNGDSFVATSGQGGSYELAATYLVVALNFIFSGPGVYSLDAKLFKKDRFDEFVVSEEPQLTLK